MRTIWQFCAVFMLALFAVGCDETGGGDYGVTDPHVRQWCDDTSGLCWSDPPSDSQQSFEEATDLCAALDIAGVTGWRLPVIEEQIGLIRGCVSDECNLSQDGCADLECYDSVCDGCGYMSGPGEGGCYWPEGFKGGLCVEFWSTTGYTASFPDEDVEYAFTVNYAQANVLMVAKETGYASTRCVRDAL